MTAFFCLTRLRGLYHFVADSIAFGGLFLPGRPWGPASGTPLDPVVGGEYNQGNPSMPGPTLQARHGEHPPFNPRGTPKASGASSLEQAKRGHVGAYRFAPIPWPTSSAVLFSGAARITLASSLSAKGSGESPDRLRCLVPKGHARPALYAACIFRQTRLAGHIGQPIAATGGTPGSGIRTGASKRGGVSSGSWGRGLGVGCGWLWAEKVQGRKADGLLCVSRLTDVCGNERMGSTWEAVHVAAHFSASPRTNSRRFIVGTSNGQNRGPGAWGRRRSRSNTLARSALGILRMGRLAGTGRTATIPEGHGLRTLAGIGPGDGRTQVLLGHHPGAERGVRASWNAASKWH